MPRKPKPPLSPLESKVMDILWQRGQATADAVRTALVDTSEGPTLKDSTVRTVLRRLEQKGYLHHRTEGRTYVYSPLEPSQSIAADAVRAVINRFCNGSVETLLVGMVDQQVVSPEKLAALAQRIAAEKQRRAD